MVILGGKETKMKKGKKEKKTKFPKAFENKIRIFDYMLEKIRKDKAKAKAEAENRKENKNG